MKKKIFYILLAILIWSAGSAEAQIFSVTGPGAVNVTDQSDEIFAPAPISPQAAYEQSISDSPIFAITEPTSAATSNTSPIVSDLSLTIKTSQEFKAGNILTFTYTITNKSSVKKDVSFIADIQCQKLAKGFISLSQVAVNAKSSHSGTFSGNQVMLDDASQGCSAIIKIVQPVYVELRKDFKIIGKPELKLGLEMSGNINCPLEPNTFLAQPSCKEDKKQLFVAGSPVYLNPVANIGDWSKVNYQAYLVSPDGERKSVTFPYLFVPNKSGLWSVEITADRLGYLSASKTVNFAVIDAMPLIRQTPLSNINTQMTRFVNDARYISPLESIQ